MDVMYAWSFWAAYTILAEKSSHFLKLFPRCFDESIFSCKLLPRRHFTSLHRYIADVLIVLLSIFFNKSYSYMKLFGKKILQSVLFRRNSIKKNWGYKWFNTLLYIKIEKLKCFLRKHEKKGREQDLEVTLNQRILTCYSILKLMTSVNWIICNVRFTCFFFTIFDYKFFSYVILDI